MPSYVTVVRKSDTRPDVRRVVIHKNVTEIAEDAFRGWKSLEEVMFEPGSRLERIGGRAFAGTALREFNAPGNLKVIGSGAFMNCEDLKAMRLNEGLEKIGLGAFQ